MSASETNSLQTDASAQGREVKVIGVTWRARNRDLNKSRSYLRERPPASLEVLRYPDR